MAWFRTSGNNGGSLKVRTASGAIASFETNMADVLQEVKCEINATGGNGTPDNPNPINGYSSANIVNVSNSELATTLKKVFDGTYGFVDLGTLTWTKDTTTVPGKIIFRAQLTNAKNGFDCLCSKYPYKGSYSNLVDKSCAYIYNTRIAIQDSTYDSATADEFKTAMSGKYLLYELDIATTPTITESVFNAIVLSFNANGTMHAIAFGQTVYGGQLIILPDRTYMHVTHKVITMDGSQSIQTSSNNRFYVNIPEAYKVDASNQTTYKGVTSEILAPTTWAGLANTDLTCGPVYGNGIAFRDDTKTSASDWTTYFTSNPTKFRYELATPFDIDLTPVQIEALLGVNNVWHDGNGNTEVKYLEVVRN